MKNTPYRLNPQKYLAFFFALFAGYGLTAQQIKIHTGKKIYVCDTQWSQVESFVIKNGKIVFTGSLDSATRAYPEAKTKRHRGYIYPGFIDAHCHFLAHCRGTKELNIWGYNDLESIQKAVQKFSKKNQRPWVVGRGWDQNKWTENRMPTTDDLKGFSTKPVCLSRIDGHAIWVNQIALDQLHLNYDTLIEGGEILKDNFGNPTGVFVDKAADWFKSFIPPLDEATLTEAVKCEAKKVYKYGLTTLDEAGLSFEEMKFYEKLHKNGDLKVRIYGMLMGNTENMVHLYKRDLPNTPYLHCPAVKLFLDGALGSRGALLKHDYCDRNGHRGLQLMQRKEFSSYLSLLNEKYFQACVHAIGDSANAIVAKEFSRYLRDGSDARWRIEHAQIMSPRDRIRIQGLSIIPSVQPTHATSDAPWAFDRLCENDREVKQGAYAYKDLLMMNKMIALGTDFPVEDMNPFATFYSAVFRQDLGGTLEQAFLPDQALSRKEALLGMTYWAAYANREDRYKGSIEEGKVADFIVLNRDLMTIEQAKFHKIRVKRTFINGECVE